MKNKDKATSTTNRHNAGVVMIVLLLKGMALAALMLACAPARHAPMADGRYDFSGVVKSVDKARKRATIQHEKVGDLMDAMTMPFVIKDEQALDRMEPGDQIKAVLVATDDGGQWLEQITTIAKAN